MPTRDGEDSGFAALPLRLRKRIDQIFDTASSSHDDSASARSRNDSPEDVQPGGFLMPDEQPGGFLLDTDSLGGFTSDNTGAGGLISEDIAAGGSLHEEQIQRNQIPLSLIPTALQLLDLPPDDADILSVFKNAASGWTDTVPRASKSADADYEQFVSRKDWRAVCAALLDTGLDSPTDSEHEDAADTLDTDNDVSEDEYMASSPEDSDDDMGGSDDEYVEGGFIPTKTTTKTKAAAQQTGRRSSRKTSKAVSSIDSEEEALDPRRPHPLTERQKQECRRTFSLFFPDIKDADLDKRRIMIKDITRVAKLLKEKITAEETVEMLEAFSSSSDKSMSLPDFERMMITAKLA
ncbi:hypothetical protein POSPLADRAFT_1137493 [Postia placenta MAD-698-R-SB12]|uniref:EF-hand domain-containing protein n=1 Tax=Postia placenta MAD-698-R-SB12 TaxID=670580 RepID=A0A1X6N6G6_9APHY|nr:hypothetical protein POSPLADRAFT_1137493 [Postia placenta MAD-698-R-SB12]OSX64217.1 hypothetical protein POSPLADRAFT_1137493 [Postia placenta MAD-698-R-SB12]